MAPRRTLLGALGALIVSALACEEELPPAHAPQAEPADYRLPSRPRCREPRADGELRNAKDAAHALAEALRASPFPCVGGAVGMDGDLRVRLAFASRCEAGDMIVEGDATVDVSVLDTSDAGAGVCAAVDASRLRVATRPRPGGGVDERSRPIDAVTWLRREAPLLEGWTSP